MVIKDLLHSYALPQVKREISKRAQEQENKKYGNGVNKAMKNLGERLTKEIQRRKEFDTKPDYKNNDN